MSGHVLLNLSNDFGKSDKMLGLPSLLLLFHNYTEQKWKRYTTIIYILRESISQKVFTKAQSCFPDIQQTIQRNSANLSRLMSELCSFKCLKLYSLIFAIAQAQIKIVMLIKIGHNCVA